ncbi:cutinase family protein [Rhodococcoides kroppenstedtii]|uniref:cutinase family protein n=1 Tax=Rhodococcoides kroppenstedtii TaxID=293050 RepID=UPI001BDF5D5E|nr:cutinase family protein [Rhodococcus kroppenstedtii]MBT1191679.1 cutinase family protein [Rhodococcus kroppenstedtii]
MRVTRTWWTAAGRRTGVVAATLLLSAGGATALAAPITPSDPLGLGDDPVESILDVFGAGTKIDVDPNNYALDCPDVLIVAVTGATDSESTRNPLDEVDRLPWSNWTGNVTVPTGEANADHPGRVGWVYVPYSSTYGVSPTEVVPTYQESVREALAGTDRFLEENKAKCGSSTKFVLLGYSVGAEVMERLAVDIGSRPATASVTSDDIAGVALVGDPYRPAGTPSLGQPGPSGGGFMSSEPKDYGTLTPKMKWFCRPGDIACDAPLRLGILPLAANVFGQMHFTFAAPGLLLTDFAAAASDLAARTIAHVFTDPDFATSDESVLDVMLRVSDRTEDTSPTPPLPSPQEVSDAVQWALGPGRPIVEAKLAAEAEGFAEDNADIPQLWEKPYLELGFVQHLYYWDNFPDNGRDWESERMIRWITDLAREQSEAPPAPAAPAESAAPSESVAPQVIPPVNPGYLAPPAPEQESIPTTFDEILKSLGIPAEPGK